LFITGNKIFINNYFLLTIGRGFINISSRIHRQAKHFDLTFLRKTFLWMVKPGVTVIYTVHNLITSGCLENKGLLRPLRPPKTPKLENKDPPPFTIPFLGRFTAPQHPQKNWKGRGKAILVIFFLCKQH